LTRGCRLLLWAACLGAGGLRLAAQAPETGVSATPAEARADEVPHLIAGVQPVYPLEYAANKVMGEVLVDFIVQADGTVTRAKALGTPDPRLAALAVEAVSKWFFSPGVRKGVAVATHLQVPVVFKVPEYMQSARPAEAADPSELQAAQHLAKGKAGMEAKDFAGALAEATAAIGLEPESGAGYLARARAYAALGREDEALEDFGEAALLDSADQAALSAYKASLPPTPARAWSALRYQTFSMVWRTVNETYFDPTFGGVDWLAVREKYRTRLAEVADDAHLVSLLQQMLGELRRTHFEIVPREAAVFNPSERVRIGTVGVEVAWVDAGVVVTQVRPDSKGIRVALAPGDQVITVDKVTLASIQAILAHAGFGPAKSGLYMTQFVESRLGAAVGTQVVLQVVSPGADPKPRDVTVTCRPVEGAWSEPIGYFPSQPIHCEARRDPGGIGLLTFNIFVPPVMKDIRSLLRQLTPGDGLIIDLRGNGGGVSFMASGICGWLCRDEFVLGAMHQRQGKVTLDVYPQTHIFDGPVAILIDGQSASTSEILAAGLKERLRARVFGETTAGAALPSVFRSLPTGDLFQYAVADVTTPSGALLEGNGVTPDVAVLRTRTDLAAGRDPVVDAAVSWLNAERSKAKPGSPASGGAKAP
jgi:carboxyl-terminal processing protease